MINTNKIQNTNNFILHRIKNNKTLTTSYFSMVIIGVLLDKKQKCVWSLNTYYIVFYILQASVVKYFGSNESFGGQPFFIFFEWKNNIIDQSFHLYTMTPWNLVAAMCGLLLALHKASMTALLCRSRLKKVKKEVKRRKTIRRMTTIDNEETNVNDVVITIEKEEKARDNKV